MDFKAGWFAELGQLWPGQAMCLEVEKVLYDKKSEYQHIVVFDSKTWGRVLVLDGVIQCTERDEFSYQEMIAHVPMFSHPNPKRVLVIGGGDGGVVREVVKHECVEKVVLCDIDKDVIEVSKQFLPHMAKAFEHPKVEVFVGDGLQFMEEHENAFDVIITDSSDPVGPAETLFTDSYYALLKRALRDGGIVCSQGECQWLHLDLVKRLLKFNRFLYPTVAYAYTCIPTYPAGQIGFVLCGKDENTSFKEPLRTITDAEAQAMDLKYYNSEIHRAAFVLPQFAKKALEDSSA